MTLAAELRAAIEERQVSQRAAARAAGISESLVSKILNGTVARVKPATLKRLSAFAGRELANDSLPAQEVQHTRLILRSIKAPDLVLRALEGVLEHVAAQGIERLAPQQLSVDGPRPRYLLIASFPSVRAAPGDPVGSWEEEIRRMEELFVTMDVFGSDGLLLLDERLNELVEVRELLEAKPPRVRCHRYRVEPGYERKLCRVALEWLASSVA